MKLRRRTHQNSPQYLLDNSLEREMSNSSSEYSFPTEERKYHQSATAEQLAERRKKGRRRVLPDPPEEEPESKVQIKKIKQTTQVVFFYHY